MTGFIALALGLLVLTIGALVWPLLRRTDDTSASTQALTAAVYRDKLAELTQDVAAGSLSQADLEHSRNELQRRLLEDSQTATAPGTAAKPSAAEAAPRSKGLAVALGALLPAATIGLYLALGTPAAVVDSTPHAQRFSQADIDKMVAELAARLEKQPDDHQGWAMLGRMYKKLGRFDEAGKAYARTGPLLETSADLLVDYADSVAAAAKGFNEASTQLLEKALKLDPNQTQALWMRGSAEFEAGRFAKAVADWERLKTLLPPESEDARTVANNLDEARRRASGGVAPSTAPSATPGASSPGTAAAAAPSPAPAAAVAAGRLAGRLLLAPGRGGPVAPGSVLMVIARPDDGSRMPAAVLRQPAGSFPASFTLDDSLSMTADRKLSSFKNVLVEVRVSRKGMAKAEAGDLLSTPVTVTVGRSDAVLTVERVQP